MNVLSLCDGMSCGQIALGELEVVFKNTKNQYFASEIKDVAIKVTMDNFPNTIQIGDVNNVFYNDGVLHTSNGNFNVNIDLVIFGSPCQSFSIAMPTSKRIGVEDKKKSGLFSECYRILKEVKPKYFLMENVKSMKNEERDNISELLNVNPIMIDSSRISSCIRKRYYWTNIPNVIQPQPKNISLQNILVDGYTDRDKGHCLMVADCRPLKTPVKMFHRYYKKGFNNIIFKSKEHYERCKKYYDNNYDGLSAKDIPINETDIFDGIRHLYQIELERCQTVPEGYTNCLTRNESADVIGDGWTIDVIAHILSFIPKIEQYK